ncbi:MAG TPA: ATP-dependent DNA helicase RecG, partial [Chitinophagaceae bacterium]|nr:ATP-dependent DNA helicase RecG [Chitinophagaceae bacterium]
MFVHSTDILLTPIEYLKGVGPVKATLLQKELQVFTFGDLLRIFPFRYTDRSKIISIANIPAEGGVVQLCGQIIHFDRVGAGRTQRLVASFRDATGTIELVWFAAISFFEKVIQEGGPFLLYGQAQKFNGYWTISHPELERFDPEKDQRLPQFTPVYPSTEKLRKQWLAGKPYVKLVQQLVAMLQPAHLPEFLPEKIRYARNLITWYEAYCAIHFPQNALQLHAAEIRLKFDELFIQQVTIARLKLNHRKQSGYTFQQVGSFFQTFYSSYLPFELTDDQKEVLREIRSDTRTGYQMNRLLQGDVGSGKTIVALLCMLLAVDNGFQACLMAPTEILARQHWQGIDELLRELPVKVAFLSGRTKGKERKSILDELKRGEIHVLIGTHALIEEPVEFHNLGLCIVDEQHRFGVAQRAKMYGKNALPPHMLVMTATPIPRTLAMTVYGDLDVSVIRHLPPGRKAITTVHRPEIQRAKVMDFLRVEIDKGRQVYIVYPLIEESEKLDYENLQSGYEQVKQYFPEPRYRIVMVHGKQSAEERESNMDRFVKGEAHIMV